MRVPNFDKVSFSFLLLSTSKQIAPRCIVCVYMKMSIILGFFFFDNLASCTRSLFEIILSCCVCLVTRNTDQVYDLRSWFKEIKYQNTINGAFQHFVFLAHILRCWHLSFSQTNMGHNLSRICVCLVLSWCIFHLQKKKVLIFKKDDNKLIISNWLINR